MKISSQLKEAAQSLRPDPTISAKVAGLRYVTDQTPGIRRERDGEGFQYIFPDGSLVTGEDDLQRIKLLAIPPAYTDVWICPKSNGYLQATGRDAKGRKQYRYHPRWREVRDETKYLRMLAFGEALPYIRKQVEQDLAKHGLPREKVIATVVRLLETTLIRVGNEEYARANRSFGLTTLHNRHVNIDGGALHFHFRGKSGKEHAIDLRDKRLARIVQRCRELPGHELFQYIDDDGNRHSIGSADVNDYLRAVTGQDFTAKDFRTWAGTVLAALALQEFESFDSEAQAKKNIVRAIEAVSARLGNTPSICRKCYVHPAILDTYLEGTMLEALQQRTTQELSESLHELPPKEAAVMALLRQRLARETKNQAKAA